MRDPVTAQDRGSFGHDSKRPQAYEIHRKCKASDRVAPLRPLHRRRNEHVDDQPQRPRMDAQTSPAAARNRQSCCRYSDRAPRNPTRSTSRAWPRFREISCCASAFAMMPADASPPPPATSCAAALRAGPPRTAIRHNSRRPAEFRIRSADRTRPQGSFQAVFRHSASLLLALVCRRFEFAVAVAPHDVVDQRPRSACARLHPRTGFCIAGR